MTTAWDIPCPQDQRYVCACCGRQTLPGGCVADLSDASCMLHAVLCYAERNSFGDWVAVPHKTETPVTFVEVPPPGIERKFSE